MDYIKDLRSHPIPAPLSQEDQLDPAIPEEDLSPPKQDLVRVVIPYLPPSSINAIYADHDQPLAIVTPNSYQEALASPQSQQWLLSMKEELNALTEQGT